MSAWILPVAHIDAIITTVVKGYKADKDSEWIITSTGEPQYKAGDIVPWFDRLPQFGGSGLITEDAATSMGQTLINANATSVDARYGETNRRQRYTYTGRGRVLMLGELAQAIGSLDYQSCEYDGWYTSKARRFLDKVEHAIYQRLDRSAFPGWTGECHVIEK